MSKFLGAQTGHCQSAPLLSRTVVFLVVFAPMMGVNQKGQYFIMARSPHVLLSLNVISDIVSGHRLFPNSLCQVKGVEKISQMKKP